MPHSCDGSVGLQRQFAVRDSGHEVCAAGVDDCNALVADRESMGALDRRVTARSCATHLRAMFDDPAARSSSGKATAASYAAIPNLRFACGRSP
jgi:hypothetical protein